MYIYMGITCFTAPPSAFKYSICACFRDVVHVSQQLCTFHRSCARFTSPLIMFVFNCIGATKHVLPIYIYTILYTQVTSNNMW